MAYHLFSKEYAVYEVPPKRGMEIIVAPKGIGDLESISGVQAILDNGYKLVCYCHNTKTAEVQNLPQGDRDRFIDCFAKKEILPWLPVRVKHLKVS